jgi:hypothetical protein
MLACSLGIHGFLLSKELTWRGRTGQSSTTSGKIVDELLYGKSWLKLYGTDTESRDLGQKSICLQLASTNI